MSISRYLELETQVEASMSEEWADYLRAEMDRLWYELTDEERKQLDERTSK